LQHTPTTDTTSSYTLIPQAAAAAAQTPAAAVMPPAGAAGSNIPTATATLPRFDVSAPPSDPVLHAKHQSLSDLLQPSYWQQLNPGLHVGDAAFIRGCKPLKPPKDRLQDLKEQINTAGVAQVGLPTAAAVRKAAVPEVPGWQWHSNPQHNISSCSRQRSQLKTQECIKYAVLRLCPGAVGI
jgi:hypothetical protein